jgi:tetratricopeptide (TPR) repeat protein
MADALARIGRVGVKALAVLTGHRSPFVRGIAVAHLARTPVAADPPAIRRALRDLDRRPVYGRGGAPFPPLDRGGVTVGKRRSFWDYNEMGVYFYHRQAYDLAIHELEQAVKAAIFPVPVLYVNLGAAYLGRKRYVEARASFERALALDPDHQKAHWFLGQTLKATGALVDALAAFERALALDPDSPAGRSAEEEIRTMRAAHPKL